MQDSKSSLPERIPGQYHIPKMKFPPSPPGLLERVLTGLERMDTDLPLSAGPRFGAGG